MAAFYLKWDSKQLGALFWLFLLLYLFLFGFDNIRMFWMSQFVSSFYLKAYEVVPYFSVIRRSSLFLTNWKILEPSYKKDLGFGRERLI